MSVPDTRPHLLSSSTSPESYFGRITPWSAWSFQETLAAILPLGSPLVLLHPYLRWSQGRQAALHKVITTEAKHTFFYLVPNDSFCTQYLAYKL